MNILYIVLFFLPTLLFLSWDLSDWKKLILSLRYKTIEDDNKVFIICQIINISIGLLYGFIGYYFALIDITPTGVIAWYLPMILLYQIFRTMTSMTVFENGNLIKVVVTIVSIVSIVGLVTYVIIVSCVLPIVITTDTHNYVEQYVTEDDYLINFSIGNIGIITEKTAARDVKTSMAEYDNISKYVSGGLYKQTINGVVTWVCPLEYASDFKAMGDSYIPGYTMIDATVNNKVTIVKDMHIVYSPSGVFSNYLYRHVRDLYPTDLLYTAMFEIDDDNNAHWIIPYGHYNWYRTFEIVDGVIIVDPETGIAEKYEIGNIPDWVNNVIPGNIAEMYCNNYGENALGWFEKTFYATSQFKLTYWNDDDAWSILFDENENLWFASDTTNMYVSGRTMIGYMMVNARTGEIKYNPDMNGINGDAICQNFIQPYNEKVGWFTSEPVVYNLNGNDVWFSEILDQNGNIMKYCIGNLDGTYFTESTMDGVLKSYANNDVNISNDTGDSVDTNDGLYNMIIKLNSDGYTIETIDGITYIYII